MMGNRSRRGVKEKRHTYPCGHNGSVEEVRSIMFGLNGRWKTHPCPELTINDERLRARDFPTNHTHGITKTAGSQMSALFVRLAEFAWRSYIDALVLSVDGKAHVPSPPSSPPNVGRETESRRSEHLVGNISPYGLKVALRHFHIRPPKSYCIQSYIKVPILVRVPTLLSSRIRRWRYVYRNSRSLLLHA